jgi:predicted nucleic acid-binding protein/antitoxin component of MazEF toxin-antitoxin module
VQVAKWGNSLAIRLPAAVVEALRLKEGDEIDIHVADEREFAVARKPSRQDFLNRLRAIAVGCLETSSLTEKRRMPGSFFDTNVLIYLATDDAAKASRAEAIVHDGGATSVQVLNEIANVARRKMKLSWQETRDFLSSLRQLLTVHPLTVDTHDLGLALAERHQLGIYDALIAASALLAECDRLWSEDMQDGMAIEGRLRIVNPFRASER